jgi:hypothetical protein
MLPWKLPLPWLWSQPLPWLLMEKWWKNDGKLEDWTEVDRFEDGRSILGEKDNTFFAKGRKTSQEQNIRKT